MKLHRHAPVGHVDFSAIMLYYLMYVVELSCYVISFFSQDLHAGPRTLLPHGASFHGYPITINVSSDLPRQELTLQVLD